jgi:hypothetical protein
VGFFVHKAPLVPAPLKRVARAGLNACGIGRIPLAIPIGNIAVIARRPRAAAARQSQRRAA